MTRTTFFLVLALSGCAGGMGASTTTPSSAQKLVVKNPFPTRDRIEKLTSAPARPMPAREVATAPSWTVDAADPKESKIEKSLPADLVLSPELRCAARELARFRSENGATPDERIDRFIVAACGRTANVQAFYSLAVVPAKVKDDEILKAWKGKLTVPADAHGKAAGAWMTRKGDNVTLAVAFADPSPIKLTPADDAGRVIVTGSVPMTSSRVVGMINQGPYAVAECENDPSVALPEFRMMCPMAEGDPWAWLQVMTHPEGHRLMHTVSLSIARRDDKPITLTRPSNLGDLPADTGAAILEGVNRTRTLATLPVLAPAVKQAAVNTRVAPHFFGAELANDSATADDLALGMLAGWDVDGGTIRNGTFFSGLISGTKDPASWLALALEMPMGRHSLLAPEARKIAIGPGGLDGGPAVGAVVTTYTMFETGSVNHDRERARVFGRINEERAKRNLPPVASLGPMPEVATLTQQVSEGKREAGEALDSALLLESRRIQHGVRGWVVVSHDLDHFIVPPELLASPQIGIEVTTYKPEGSPWGAFLIYVITPSDATSRQIQL